MLPTCWDIQHSPKILQRLVWDTVGTWAFDVYCVGGVDRLDGGHRLYHLVVDEVIGGKINGEQVCVVFFCMLCFSGQ